MKKLPNKNIFKISSRLNCKDSKGGSRHKNWCTARVLSFLIRYFSNYYGVYSIASARAAPLDPRLDSSQAFIGIKWQIVNGSLFEKINIKRSRFVLTKFTFQQKCSYKKGVYRISYFLIKNIFSKMLIN